MAQPSASEQVCYTVAYVSVVFHYYPHRLNRSLASLETPDCMDEPWLQLQSVPAGSLLPASSNIYPHPNEVPLTPLLLKRVYAQSSVVLGMQWPGVIL